MIKSIDKNFKPIIFELEQLKTYGRQPNIKFLGKANKLLHEMVKRGIDLKLVENYGYRITFIERSVGEFIIHNLKRVKIELETNKRYCNLCEKNELIIDTDIICDNCLDWMNL